MTAVSGSTRLAYVVADPIVQVRTPAALNEVLAERGVDAITLPAHVVAESLASFLDGIRATENADGLVISVPHKQSVVGLIDELGPQAGAVGAVNAIRRLDDGRLLGETFDGLGFVAGLTAEGIHPSGMRAAVIGSGGAARAIAVALATADIASLQVINRTPERARSLVEAVRMVRPELPVEIVTEPDEAALLVNATSLGMRAGDPSPAPSAWFRPGLVAADVVMSGEPTAFLVAAADGGARPHPGVRMLRGQIPLLAEFLFGSGS